MSNLSDAEAGEDSIQFQCTQCQHQLKVPIQAAGKRAQCPRCSNVQPVPERDAPIAEALGLEETPPSSGLPHIDVGGGGHSAPAQSWNDPSKSSPMNQTSNPIQNPLASSPMNPQNNPASPVSAPTTSSPLNTSPLNASMPIPPGGNPVAPTTAPISLDKRDLARGVDRQHEGEQTQTRELYRRICQEVGKIYIGQEELILGTLVSLFSSGHVLIESVPGLGKTLFVRTLGKVLGCDFGRIQFTADLMPSDVTGAPIFSMKTNEFEFRKGPVFTQLLLADEINRSPAKTHAALLEIMQEYRVTVDGKTHQLQKPFLVMATQNPIESEGTYNLPEAQLDRFMFKLYVDYPSEAEEALILDQHSRQVNIEEQLDKEVETVTSPEEIVRITHENADVRIVPALIDYINKIVRMTRQWPQFHMGASPRAGLALMQGARTLAAFSGRDYAIPDDVIEITLPTLRHRIMLTAEAEVEGHRVDDLLREMIRTIEVPRI